MQPGIWSFLKRESYHKIHFETSRGLVPAYFTTTPEGTHYVLPASKQLQKEKGRTNRYQSPLRRGQDAQPGTQRGNRNNQQERPNYADYIPIRRESMHSLLSNPNDVAQSSSRSSIMERRNWNSSTKAEPFFSSEKWQSERNKSLTKK